MVDNSLVVEPPLSQEDRQLLDEVEEDASGSPALTCDERIFSPSAESDMDTDDEEASALVAKYQKEDGSPREFASLSQYRAEYQVNVQNEVRLLRSSTRSTGSPGSVRSERQDLSQVLSGSFPLSAQDTGMQLAGAISCSTLRFRFESGELRSWHSYRWAK